MENAPGKATGTVTRGKLAMGRNVLGVTADGVRILKPKKKSTHFTIKEIREAVAAIRAAKSA